MDIHRNVGDVTAAAAAEAHRKDLATQSKHGVEDLRYWYNEAEGPVFCVCRAPSLEAAEPVHREAHGMADPFDGGRPDALPRSGSTDAGTI